MPERRIGRRRPQLATAWRTARCWNPACQPAAAREPASCARHRHGAWAEADYNPLEEEFLGKLKAIDGVSQVET